jgi:hypothetical protein
MTTSFTSKAMVIMDIPEVASLDAEFVYNFFRPDERVNEAGTEYDLSGYQPQEQANLDVSQARKLLHLGVARYIKITFSPVFLDPTFKNEGEAPMNQFSLGFQSSTYADMLDANKDKIQDEIRIATKGTSAIILHDPAMQKRLAKFIKFSLSLRDPEAAKGGSTSEQAKKLNDLTSDAVVGNIIFNNVHDPATEGMFFIDTNTGRVKKETREFAQANKRLYCQINDRYLGAIFKNCASHAFGPFAAQISQKVNDVSEIADLAKLLENPAVISANEYSTNLHPMAPTPKDELIQQLQTANVNIPTMWSHAKVIGYIIKKEEILPNGTRDLKDPIIVSSVQATSLIDTKVKYGAMYSYSVRAIVLYRYQAMIAGKTEVMMATSLLGSRPSTPVIISCEEFSPPPPPVDFTILWSYGTRHLRLFWSMPVVSSRDVKRFQIFRRKSIYDSFELLREYDFDNSDIQTPRKETPTQSRVIVSDTHTPRGSYVDEEFTKDSTYIYALCSVDAHDISSNYSQQFLVSFDRHKNVLVKRLLSPSGAPKPYPNFYLLPDIGVDVGATNLTVDAMKDSFHKEMKIYFDPEYLTIKDADGGELELIHSLQSDSSYKLQLINVDRQKSQVLNIKIDDLRTL